MAVRFGGAALVLAKHHCGSRTLRLRRRRQSALVSLRHWEWCAVPDVTMPADAAAGLAAYALDCLWAADQEDDGCCPTCCAPCHSLKEMLDGGQLDDVVRAYAVSCGGSVWWDLANDQVDRAWLDRAWRMTECHK